LWPERPACLHAPCSPALPRRAPAAPPQLLLYLSRAYYDSDNLLQAKKCLLRAIHLDPTNYALWFNAALTMQVRCGARGVCAWLSRSGG